MSSRNFKSPPVMREDMTYEDWKSDVEIWSDFTDLEPEKKGSAVFLTLVGKSQQTVRAGVTRAEMKSAAGLQKVLTCLDELYKKDEASSGFSAYEDFSDYRRPAGVSIKDYLVEFNLKYSKLKAYKMELPEGVLAYYVLKCANLTDEQTNICKATCTDLKYSDMKKQIEKVTSNSGRADKHSQDISVQSQFYMDGEVDYVDECYYEGDHGVGTESAECDTYYVHPGQSTLQYQYRPGGSRRGMSFSQRGATMTSGPRLNTPDEFGNPTRCSFCKSTYHYVGQCPDAAKQAAVRGRGASTIWRPGRRGMRGGRGGYFWHEDSPVENVVLLAEDKLHQAELLGETFGHAIIDSGCSRTVCGRSWLESYLETLHRSEMLLVESHPDLVNFRFGDSEVIKSNELAVISVQFGSQQIKLMTNVVECDIPLLLSRETLKRAGAEIDFKSDTVVLLGEKIDVVVSKSGHLCVPLPRRLEKQGIKQVLFSSPVQSDDDKANEAKIVKLHKQFAHPSSDRLKKLIRDSGVVDSDLGKMVDTVTLNCNVCKKYRRPPPRPIVSFPLATDFNEVVAMDIKFIDGVPILHLIDHATRYSMACRVRNKKPETIVECILNHWIRVFGHPKFFLTDNGGEFVNDTLLELCEKFSVELKTTAAESAWSNGLVERHNAVIGDNVCKIMSDIGCSMDIAIPWAVCAKNSLSSVYGFAPNQLVFGRNVNLPNVESDKLSAQNESCVNGKIAAHLMALHRARQAFIAQESCEKLRRALNKQTRTFSDVVYQNGDKVYYKRNNNKEWHGPSKVLGRDGSQYLLKHGGSYVRVHPCKMQMVECEIQKLDACSVSKGSVTSHKVKDESTSVKRDAFTQYDLPDQCILDVSIDDDDDDCTRPSQGLMTPPATPAHEPHAPHVAHAPVFARDDNVIHNDALDVDEGPDVMELQHDSSEDEDNLDAHRHQKDAGCEISAGEDTTSTVPLALRRLGDYNKPPEKQAEEDDHTIHVDDEASKIMTAPKDLPKSSHADDQASKIVKAPKDLPKAFTTIEYRHDGEDWIQGDVISAAGKKTTANWHFMNIKHQHEEEAQCVSLKGVEWKEHPPDKSEEDVKEIYFGSTTDSSRFLEAKQAEIEKWKEFKTYVEVPDTGQPRISTKWVCTEKMKGGQRVTKARLVARGFEEDKSQLRTDSPTCSKESLRMLISILAAKKWKLQSIDIKSAYLQGNDIARDIYLQPPKEAHSDKLWKLLKTPYGIADAGRKWYIRVQKEFTALGAKTSRSDRSVFIWEDQSRSSPCGILIVHVDDFLYGGNRHFLQEIIPQIRSVFRVGTEEEDCFKYLGLHVSETTQGVRISLEEYISSMKEMNTGELGLDKKRVLESGENSELKRLIGQINWVSTQSRPDISFENCMLGGRVAKAIVADVHQANKVVRKIRGQTLDLMFPNDLELSSVGLVCFCDASLANLQDKGSQGGFLIFLVDGAGAFSLLCWQSKRIKRVVNSSLSAECLEAVDAAETCLLISDRLEEMLCRPSGSIKITLVTDNRSLVDAVHRSTSVENRRLQIDISMLREMVERNEINEFRWINSEHQIANSLTKRGVSSDYLLHILQFGYRYDHTTGLFMQ